MAAPSFLPLEGLCTNKLQMPIIDGYRATHILRHHSPYRYSTCDIPIVAMTASAIQGDREKCQKAGMDDYLAKPVKGKTLEKMLVRWAINRRVPKTKGEVDDEGSDCAEVDNENCAKRSAKSKYVLLPSHIFSSHFHLFREVSPPVEIESQA